MCRGFFYFSTSSCGVSYVELPLFHLCFAASISCAQTVETSPCGPWAIITSCQLVGKVNDDYVRFIAQCCCCLPTPMTLASGGSPMFPLVVHQPASPSIWPAVQSPRRGLSTNPWVTMWCVCGRSRRDDVCRVCGCHRGGTVVMDVIRRRLCAVQL